MSANTKTPVELLRAAAELLRERATKATPGPWNYCRIDGRGETPEMAKVFGGPFDEYGYLTSYVASWVEEDEDGGRLSHEDGDWLEAVHPGIAEPLAALLDDAAERAADSIDLHPALIPHARWQKALAVARVVLREEIPAVSA